MCCIPQNSGRINVMHSQWVNIGGYHWAGFGLVFVTDWAEKKITIWQHWSVIPSADARLHAHKALYD